LKSQIILYHEKLNVLALKETLIDSDVCTAKHVQTSSNLSRIALTVLICHQLWQIGTALLTLEDVGAPAVSASEKDSTLNMFANFLCQVGQAFPVDGRYV